MKRAVKIFATTLAAASMIAGAPQASAAEAPGVSGAFDRVWVATTYSAGAIGDVFECGGAIGRYWCP